jgi:1-acyl-sn-glycerol-3-phosphate acyltransferase
MLRFLPGFLRGILALFLLITNLLICFIPIFPFALVKLTIPLKSVRKFTDSSLNYICTRWASINGFILRLLNRIEWDIQGDQNLRLDNWYLVLSNHQSWADIIILQYVLNNKIPYFRFFLKQQLIWLPVFNFVWAALDYPYMKRYSKAYLDKYPHLKGKDLETTKKSCEKFRNTPVSIMNFVEGTRFTKEKKNKQKSPYQHLLLPKAGGVAFVLSAMGEQMTAILDVTIKYHPHAVGILDFFSGHAAKISVRINHLPLTEEITGDYFSDPEYKERFQVWINQIWEEKDKKLATL